MHVDTARSELKFVADWIVTTYLKRASRAHMCMLQ